MSLQYYTFYLLNGQRKVFLGSDPQDAYTNNQSYEDGQRPIMLIDEGVTDNYYWNKCTWIKKTEFYLANDVPTYSIDKELFYRHNVISFIYDNKDELIIARRWGQFASGWIRYIEVYYAEYQGDNEYLVTGTQYYTPKDFDNAIKNYLDRLHSAEPAAEIEDSESIPLGVIHRRQTPDDIYVNLTTEQKVRLLGGLIKRLECHDDLQACISEGSIYKPSIVEHRELRELVDQIDYYCNALLVTHTGDRDYDHEAVLTKHYGWSFEILGHDSYGTRRTALKTDKFKIIYG